MKKTPITMKTETQHVFLCFLIVLYSIGQITCVRITKLTVPPVALEGDLVHLTCDYEEENGSSLYTLKWYKDAQEFYRHQPGISPHTVDDRCTDYNRYDVPGVNVDCWISTERKVVLRDVTRLTSGEYKCEVIGEHPKFSKREKKSVLTVYSESLSTPHIVGAEELYGTSDYVSLNCSFTNDEYEPELSWHINGHPADQNYLYRYDKRTLGLMFQAREDLFHRGMISVSCISSLGDVHRKSKQKQLRSRRYLTAQEYQLNAGERKHPSVEMMAVVLVPSAVLQMIYPLV